MRLPASLKWIGLALLGLLIATAVALAATGLISRQIGIESITASDTLAPAFDRTAEPETRAESQTRTEAEEPGSDDGRGKTAEKRGPREGEIRARLRAEKVAPHPQPDLPEETVEVPRRIHSSVAFRQPLFNTASKHGS